MEKADVIFLNGKVATVDEEFSLAEAVAVKSGWIIAVDSNEKIKKYLDEATEVIDLQGKLMLPGTHDAHMHGVHTGLSLSPLFLDVRFPKVKKISDLQEIIRAAVEKVPEGAWIVGMGWNEMLIEECLAEGRTLKKWDLDVVSPNNPVVLNDYGAHRMVVNSQALGRCDISEKTPDLPPEAGLIERLENSREPTGYLNEWGAQVLVWQQVPTLPAEEIEACILEMNRELNKYGITSHVDILGIGGNELIRGTWGEKSIGIYEKLAREDKLTARVSINLLAGIDGIQSYQAITEGLEKTTLPDFQDRNWVKAETVKIFGDGGGWLREDNQVVGDHGRSTFPGETDLAQEKELIKTIIEVHRRGWQLGIHAIGGRTIDTIIEGYKQALEKYPRENPRHFIIHGDDMTVENAQVAAKYDISMSVQAVAAYQMMDFMRFRFDEEYGNALFAWDVYQKAGVNVANGSDSNIFSLNWLEGAQFAVTRQTVSGNKYRPDLASERADVIRMYTINGAKQEHLEAVRGSIEVGKVADFQILDQDILMIPPEEIGKTKVVMTMVDGKIVYKNS